MPLVINKEVQPDVHIGLWHITEDVDELLSGLVLTPAEERIFATLHGLQRRQQWLSYRRIIKRILNLDRILEIDYDRFGRPTILNHHSKISVSHSHDYSAAIVSGHGRVGIDIELMHPRIEKVVKKFMNEAELEMLNLDYSIGFMNTVWSAKEALYKLYGRRKLDFRENIRLDPFSFKGQGQLHGAIIKGESSLQFRMRYETVGNYVMVWVVEGR
jgi:4'-phosphopantetheinyl transferase